jgi:hypothetical protein
MWKSQSVQQRVLTLCISDRPCLPLAHLNGGRMQLGLLHQVPGVIRRASACL